MIIDQLSALYAVTMVSLGVSPPQLVPLRILVANVIIPIFDFIDFCFGMYIVCKHTIKCYSQDFEIIGCW